MFVVHVKELSSVIYNHFVIMSVVNKMCRCRLRCDHSVNMGSVNEMMRLSSARCDYSDEVDLYTRVIVDVVDQ